MGNGRSSFENNTWKRCTMKTVFIGGKVFVGDGRIIENGTVIVEGDRIIGVAESGIPVLDDVKKISLEDRMLFPGFIDAHVHLTMDAGLDPSGAITRGPDPLIILKAANFARQTLMAGITSVRDLGGKNHVDLILRDAISAGIIPGPRMKAAGHMITMTGGHGWDMGHEADGMDGMRKAVRGELKAGVDVVKLMATGGLMTPGVEPASPQLSEDELRAGIEEAHKAGRRTASHAQGNQGIKNAVRAGIDSIEHGFYLDEEAVSLMAERNTYFIPTLSIYSAGRRAIESGIPQALVDEMLSPAKESHYKSARMAREAGLKVGMGTDAGTPFNFHGKNLSELMHLVEVGYSPLEALHAGTGISAEIVGVADEVGTIEEGKLADIVVIRGNPINDISSLLVEENVLLVMKGGEIVKGG
jgi:imidazolonepropionase-like amidohydrolase